MGWPRLNAGFKSAVKKQKSERKVGFGDVKNEFSITWKYPPNIIWVLLCYIETPFKNVPDLVNQNLGVKPKNNHAFSETFALTFKLSFFLSLPLAVSTQRLSASASDHCVDLKWKISLLHMHKRDLSRSLLGTITTTAQNRPIWPDVSFHDQENHPFSWNQSSKPLKMIWPILALSTALATGCWRRFLKTGSSLLGTLCSVERQLSCARILCQSLCYAATRDLRWRENSDQRS